MTLEKIATSKDFIMEKDGEISVDWEGLVKLNNRLGYSNRNSWTRISDEVLEYLQEKGLLTHKSKESYRLVGHGMDLGPSLSYSKESMK